MKRLQNYDNGLQDRWTRTPGFNKELANMSVRCFADTFVVNQNLVLRIISDSNRDVKNRQLLIAENRYLIIYLRNGFNRN